METRELRYFVTVAEELHFSPAAERLGIAQPPLSRAIQQLERRLGVTLFDRNRRGVTLTGAGQVLLHEARAILDAAAAAARRTRRAASFPNSLTLATKAGTNHELLRKLLDAHAAEPEAAEIEVLLCGMGDQARMLRDGRADVALMQRPFDALAGFDTEDTARPLPSRRRAHPHGRPAMTRTRRPHCSESPADGGRGRADGGSDSHRFNRKSRAVWTDIVRDSAFPARTLE
ncbi:LysR family transcriptional regulator [Actinoplanes sp. NEAU-A12]|uniref:LysR family transcriptional regulator n=1 Tax=Actinoplanes sandaracinus TaxID=3045177 RepID=A0ABT6WZM9_9ACTN|nr:LysR family transcriptional regulator [Actinoplanes sandaracinus]MDI6105203.1 LysR family transcriptional regulator [Actinoplanes sandaracinus]